MAEKKEELPAGCVVTIFVVIVFFALMVWALIARQGRENLAEGEGLEAGRRGRPAQVCPYKNEWFDGQREEAWLRGWMRGWRDAH